MTIYVPGSSSIEWPQSDDADAELPASIGLFSGDGLAVVTLRGRIVVWNDASEDLLKLPRARALGSLLADVARTPVIWEAIWGHHITTVGAHLSGNPPVRRVLNARDNVGDDVTLHISSTLLAFADHLPFIAYSYTVERVPEDDDVERPPPLGLTAREWEVACLLMSGLGTSEIGRELDIAYATVRSHVRNILVTLDANTRTQALMRLWSRFGAPANARFPRPDRTNLPG